MQDLDQTLAPEDDDDTRDARIPRVGAAVRRLRHAKAMTLQELADASGVSVGMLSQLERDRANPSLRVLTQIRDALGAPISALFEDNTLIPADPAFVCRAANRPRLEFGYLSKELLSPRGPKNLQFMILHIPPKGTSGDQPMSYPAEKGGMILQGALYLRVGAEEALLTEGDSFLFESNNPHSFRNPRDTEAKILWIVGAVAESHL